MQLIENQLYHYYSQGNNKGKIFFSRENYLFFLEHFRKFVLPFCKVLAYCLMPNHFHFIIYTTKHSVIKKKIGGLMVPSLNNGFRQLLSAYSQAINKQENRSGSLFRQRTKAKFLTNNDENYPVTCFHYVHQNPFKAGLVNKMEDWEFSSFQDYIGLREGTLCDQHLAFELLGLSKETIFEDSYKVILSEMIDRLDIGG
jgi:putative transposase